MKKGLPGGTLQRVIEGASSKGGRFMLHAGLDLSRKRLDYCLLDEHGDHVEVGAAPPDPDGLAGFTRRVEERHRQPGSSR